MKKLVNTRNTCEGHKQICQYWTVCQYLTICQNEEQELADNKP